jgi:hypothetical protein
LAVAWAAPGVHVGDRKARKARGLEWGTVVDEEAGGAESTMKYPERNAAS